MYLNFGEQPSLPLPSANSVEVTSGREFEFGTAKSIERLRSSKTKVLLSQPLKHFTVVQVNGGLNIYGPAGSWNALYDACDWSLKTNNAIVAGIHEFEGANYPWLLVKNEQQMKKLMRFLMKKAKQAKERAAGEAGA